MKVIIKTLILLTFFISLTSSTKIRELGLRSAVKGGVSNFKNLFSSFNHLVGKLAPIIKQFIKNTTTFVKETIIGKGFEYFESKCDVQFTKGIKEETFLTFARSLANRLKIPEDKIDDVISVFEEAEYSEKSSWTSFNILYNSRSEENEAKYAAILITKNEEENTYDVLYTDISSEFKLVEDVLIVTKRISILGNLFHKDKDIKMKQPKKWTEEDLQGILDFFQIIVDKKFSDLVGLNVELPKPEIE